MKSLERKSPRKSPLAKYHKLRKRSPCKFQLNPPKSRLDVSIPRSNSGLTNTCLVIRQWEWIPTTADASTMAIRKELPEVIHQSSDRLSLKLSMCKDAVDSSSSATTLQDGSTKGDDIKVQDCNSQSGTCMIRTCTIVTWKRAHYGLSVHSQNLHQFPENFNEHPPSISIGISYLVKLAHCKV